MDKEVVGDDDGADYAAEDGRRASKQTPFPVDHLLLPLLTLQFALNFFPGILVSILPNRTNIEPQWKAPGPT